MSFNSEKANVRAKIASGDFKKQEDPFKPFFSRLADGIVARDAEQRAIDREIKREERAKIKRDQAAQETIDAKKAKEERLVDLYLTQQNRKNSNKNYCKTIVRPTAEELKSHKTFLKKEFKKNNY